MSTDINKISENHTLGVKMGETRDDISTESLQRDHRGEGVREDRDTVEAGVRSPFFFLKFSLSLRMFLNQTLLDQNFSKYSFQNRSDVPPFLTKLIFFVQ